MAAFLQSGERMRIIFVRHGEPDYEHDCLTETGHRQAAAAAERLADMGISEIFSSPMGRAQQTAAYTAERLGLPVRTLDYMHEISWGGAGIPDDGHPWVLSERMINEENFDFFAQDWREHPYFRGNTALRYYDRVAAGIDGFLMEHGYRHEGRRCFCKNGSDKTVALFSHGGSSNCALAHILSLPLPYVAAMLPYSFTSVITVELPAAPGEYVHPMLMMYDGKNRSTDWGNP